MRRPRPVLALLEFGMKMATRAGRALGRSRAPSADEDRAARGVQAAFFYLRRADFVVVAESWRDTHHPGDLDLVAWDGGTLCFIEVKTRNSGSAFAAEFLVGREKQQTIVKLGEAYTRQLPWQDGEPPQVATRFDVASVYVDSSGKADVQLLRDAFH